MGMINSNDAAQRQSHQTSVKQAEWQKGVEQRLLPAAWRYSQGRRSLPHYIQDTFTIITNLILEGRVSEGQQHFKLHSFWEDTTQCPRPTLTMQPLWSSIWRQRSWWPLEKCIPLTRSRCDLTTFLQRFTSQTSDHPTSALAEILYAYRGLLLLPSPSILMIYNTFHAHAWDFPSTET